jgi:hypothetical protein
MLNKDQISAYANFRSFAVRYDLEKHNFSYWYAPAGCIVSEAIIEDVYDKEGKKILSLHDYSKVSSGHQQGMDDTTLTITYSGGPEILSELIIVFVVSKNGVRFSAGCWGTMDVRISGKLHWGEDMEHDTFAVCLDRQKPDLRSALGPAASTVDNSLFDRKNDRALEFFGYGSLRFAYDWNGHGYRFTACTDGNDWTRGFSIRVHEHIYEDRLAIPYKPINKKNTFPVPPCGWMTWYAVQFDASEKTVLDNARWQKERLADFGAAVIWVDWEWYHSNFGGIGKEGVHSMSPDPVRYPNGLGHVADEIKKLGFIPALWIGASNEPAMNREMEKSPEMILVHRPSWCGQYFFDYSNKTYLNDYIPKVFNQIKDWGYQALKWDCNPTSIEYTDLYHDGMIDRELTTEQAWRRVIQKARDTVGENFYMLYCAGTGARDAFGAADIFDATRIGGDIFRWSEFISQCVARVMKFYYCHNVILYNDPDNVVIRPKFNNFEQALSRVSFISALGLPVTLGDNLPDLPEERVELLRRALPALDIHPMDIRETIHDYRIVTVNLAVEKQFLRWNVVDVLNLQETDSNVSVDIEEDLHLEAGSYLVYDFWNRRFLGESHKKIDMNLGPCASVVLAVHRKQDVPQFLSTSRHISQGGADLIELSWDDKRLTLRGVSNVVKNDPYEIVLYIPSLWRINLEGNDTDSSGWKTDGHICRLTHQPEKTGEFSWSVQFAREAGSST